MKQIILIFGLISIISCQTESVRREKSNYQKEMAVSADKEIVYQKSLDWLHAYYGKNDGIMKRASRRKYRLISKKVVLDETRNYHCTLDISILKNKLKVTYKNISHPDGKEITPVDLIKLEPKLNTAIYNLQDALN